LWIFVVSIKYSLCSHQVRDGFPNVFQVGPHFIQNAFLQLHPFGTGGKHWTYVFEVNTSILGEFSKFAQLSAMSIKETHAKLNSELEMHNEQSHLHQVKN
jgi:hypothetical protein